MLYKSYLLCACLVSLVSSLAFSNVPIATPVSNHGALFGLSPTPAPALEELRRRQATQVTQQTLLAAPDNTCGYFNGSSTLPWGCATGNCVFATPTAVSNGTKSAAGNVLCCDPKTGCPAQPAPTACVDRYRNDYNKTCTGSCPTDPMTLKCTSGIYLFCNTITFTTPDISAFFCNYISTYVPLPAETTFAGQIGHNFTTTVAKFATTPGPTTSLSSASAKSSSTGSYSASATAAAASSTGAKTTNKKAIIGGVVGGVLGLALIIGAVIMFLRSRNTREEAVEQKGAASSSEAISAPVAEPAGTSKTVITANSK